MARNPLLRTFSRHLLKPLTFWLLALPGIWLAWQWAMLLNGQPHGLGFNPIETTHRFLGDTAIRILLISLAVTPIRDLTKWGPIMMVRRRIGLAAFWYALLHILAYLGLDLFIEAGTASGAMAALWRDVTDRIYITLGMSAFILLIPMAITSFNGMQRLLGSRRWQGLHRLVYPLAILAVLHHGFMVKGFQLAPWIHGGILAALLVYRLVGMKARKRPQPSASKS
ncbi:sulfite oxidase heme-binding subunit YedZ [uncultured Maricaulis sp.]|uniref:sulfite oxidase heme-binding subunit YedZ n=1 Tax=uncultured Maricaulis sp. TaxID=174710 RepID=UPI0026139ED7|nr:protein-methionine-sulfoxide reductase heme-binding subunit MsrQ [uncultured Maricaulis sp.]